MMTPTSTTRQLIPIVNQLFDMERKLDRMGPETSSLKRNIERIKRYLTEMHIHYHNPIGENYDETRTDCEASISGESIDGLSITEVIKPIIYQHIHGMNQIVQQAVVIVQGTKTR